MRHLIRNGRVIDPSQRIDARLNLLIEGEKILALTAEEPPADVVTDASGFVVCPGFIDIHAHEDPEKDGVLYRDEHSANLACLLRMGVTSCLAGNCGDNFCEPVAFLDRIDREGCFVNVAMLAGYTYYREKFSRVGRYSPVTEAERDRICIALGEALEKGCAGISFGLEYVPGMDETELLAAAFLCAEPFWEKKKMISAHIRYCAERAPAAAAEILRVGEKTGVQVQLSHIGSMAGYGQMEEFLSLVDAFRAAGVAVGCDCYPYTAFSTFLGSAPYDDLAQMHCDYKDIELCEGRYNGQRCTREIFERERREHPEILTVGHVMREEEILLAYRHPNVAVGSDCFLSEGRGHPRAAGAFARFLHLYAKSGPLSLYEAIGRITSLPAEFLGLAGKGTLRPGSDADLVLFDPDAIRDCATFSSPTLPPEGIEAVMIAGEIAVRRGKIVNGRLGRAIRK